ncbi:uncharacterized protein LOC130698012 [Daphnia carinata]|uniref:uncharacterized protein LOC130698012 n=1 Tax=Daphnia carinata TaxID=120202 RepID=UPI0025794C19|nr:uncharacterized protein LOC130698012 [Daphnia carinata]
MLRSTVFLLALISLCSGQPGSARYSYFNQFQAGKPSPALGRFFFPFRPYTLPFGPFYLPDLIPTSIITVTQVVPTTFTRTVDAYCIDGATSVCSVRRKRAVLEEDQLVYVNGQPFQPSEVSRMLATEMPMDSRVPAATALLDASMTSPEETAREGRAKQGQWYFATTTTVTMTAVTVVNSTNAEIIPISIAGCIPACLTTLALC